MLRSCSSPQGKVGPKLMKRKQGKWSAAGQQRFLDCLARTANVRAATREAGVSYTTPYLKRRRNPAFRRAWEAALLEAYGALERRMLDHAINGVPTKVRYHGAVVDEEIVYNEAIAFNLLKLHKGEVVRLREREAAAPGRDPDEIERELEAKLALIATRIKGAGPEGGAAPAVAE